MPTRGPRRRVLPRHADGWRPSTPTRSTAGSRRSSGASAATTSTSSCRGGGAARRRRRFNLARMFVGSEGTLGLTVEAKLRLVELPRARATLVVEFADLLEALAATPLDPAAPPGGRRGGGQVRAGQHAAQSRGDPAPRLPPGRSRGHPDDRAVRRPRRRAAAPAGRAGGRTAAARVRLSPPRPSPTPPPRRGSGSCARWRWGCRWPRRGTPRRSRSSRTRPSPPSTCATTSPSSWRSIARHGTTAGVYAHASVGCLHVRPVINLKTEEGVRRFEAIAEEVADLVLKYGGALSGEHGDGLVRSPFQEKMYGPVLYEAFRELKRTFDPHNLLNPGKIVDAPPLAANLRYGPAYVTPAVPTTFDFSADGGLLPAAELCAGRRRVPEDAARGRCARRSRRPARRRTAPAAGPTCCGWRSPASSALKDSPTRTSTRCSTSASSARRARASARPTSTWPGSRPSSCTSIIREHGFPLRNRVFGHVAGLGRIGVALAPLSNWLARSGPSRWLNEKLLGIDRRRMPPAFARRSLVRRFRGREPSYRRCGSDGPPSRSRRSCSSPTRSPTISSPRSARRRSSCCGAPAGPSRSARRDCAAAAGR